MQVLYKSEFEKGLETIDIDLKISHRNKERNLYEFRFCDYLTLWISNKWMLWLTEPHISFIILPALPSWAFLGAKLQTPQYS